MIIEYHGGTHPKNLGIYTTKEKAKAARVLKKNALNMNVWKL